MTTLNTYTMTDSMILVVIDGNTLSIARDHPEFNAVSTHLLKSKMSSSPSFLLSKMKKNIFTSKKHAGLKVENGVVYLRRMKVDGLVGKHMIRAIERGEDCGHLINFVTRCRNNPRPEAIGELYEFLHKAKLPIASDGRFFAFKKVRADYHDIRTGRFSNCIGDKPAIPFSDVDPNRERVCSDGLHWCSYDYLSEYGDMTHYEGGSSRVMVLLVDPADVGAIPTDYDFTKGRSSTYEIIGEVTREEDFDDISGMNIVSKYQAYDDTQSAQPMQPLKITSPDGKVSRTHIEVIQAMKNHPTKIAAAKALGIHRDSLRRWHRKASDFHQKFLDKNLGDFRNHSHNGVKVGVILDALEASKNNVEAGERLGIHRDTVRRWKKKLREVASESFYLGEGDIPACLT